MTRVLVTGGTGNLGQHVVSRLLDKGYTVRVMSRSPKRPNAANVEWAQADLTTGQGVAEAVRGVDVIVHAASDAQNGWGKTDAEGTRLLLNRAHEAGVGYVLYISIVGIENVPFQYYQNKLATERVVAESGMKWATLRATQFFEFIDLLLTMFTKYPISAVPMDWKSQPIDVGEVADHIVQVVAEQPQGLLPDLAGPEILSVRDILRAWKRATRTNKLVLHLPLPGKMAAGFRKGGILAPNAKIGRMTWTQWLQRRYGEAAQPRTTAPAYRAKG